MAARTKKDPVMVLAERIENIARNTGSTFKSLEAMVGSLERASLEYRKTHWGKRPREVVMVDAADPSGQRALPALGELHSICYETRKGKDRRPVLYEHEFEATKPLLLYVPAQRGRLVIAGGSYKVDERGIIG